MDKYYCPNCADFTANRIYPQKSDGFTDTPICKHCGSDCDDFVYDDRLDARWELGKEAQEAKATWERCQMAYDRLDKAIEKDWFSPERGEVLPIYVNHIDDYLEADDHES